jgi:hypothetical protein
MSMSDAAYAKKQRRESEEFWDEYERRANEPGPKRDLFPPLVQTAPGARVQPDLAQHPPDAILSGLVVQGNKEVVLCRWDNFSADKAGQAGGGAGGSRHLYLHVAAEELRRHCPQLLSEFRKNNCGNETGEEGPALRIDAERRTDERGKVGNSRPSPAAQLDVSTGKSNHKFISSHRLAGLAVTCLMPGN